nr:integrase core domain-containing protein [Bifidobacterium callimiconis]
MCAQPTILLAHVAFATDAYARRIVGWAVASSMCTEELPLQALKQAIMWARCHVSARNGCVHHSDHGSQYIGLVYSTHVADAGMLLSTGTVGDSCDNTLAKHTNMYERELIRINKPYRSICKLEYVTLQWISWYNTKRLYTSLGYRTPEQVENEYYQQQTARAAS